MVEFYNIRFDELQFARTQKEIDAFRKQFHVPLERARFFTQPTSMLIPKHPAVDDFLETYKKIVWGEVEIPPGFRTQPFSSRTLATPEQLQAVHDLITALVETKSPEAKAEGAIINNAVQIVIRENEELDFIKTRVLEFVKA